MEIELVVALIAGGASLLGGLAGTFIGRGVEHDQWKRDRKLEAYGGYLRQYRRLQSSLILGIGGNMEKAKELTDAFTMLHQNDFQLLASQQVAFHQNRLNEHFGRFLEAMAIVDEKEREAKIATLVAEEGAIGSDLGLAMRRDLRVRWTRFTWA